MDARKVDARKVDARKVDARKVDVRKVDVRKVDVPAAKSPMLNLSSFQKPGGKPPGFFVSRKILPGWEHR